MIKTGRTETIVIVRTEKWATRRGVVAKAVVRDSKGRFNGMTDQTKSYGVFNLVLGK